MARDASADEIKKAYRRLARELHPDVNPDGAGALQGGHRAYEVLSDPKKREMYDLGGDPFATGGGSGRASASATSWTPSSAGRRRRGPRPRHRRGQDALIRLELDLAEAAFGVTRDLGRHRRRLPDLQGAGAAPGTSPRTCDVCSGRGEVQQVTRIVPRPGHDRPAVRGLPGLRHDHPRPVPRVRRRRPGPHPPEAHRQDPARGRHRHPDPAPGEGEVGPGGGPAGDLYVEILERPHAIFPRKGDDLHCTVTVPMTAAALGTALTLETLDGAGPRVRPGTSPARP